MCHFRLKPLPLQKPAEKVAHIHIVVYDQNPFHINNVLLLKIMQIQRLAVNSVSYA
jgi:hypothetical protein